MATYVCPKDMILDKLKETLEEVRNRVPDEKPPYRARVAVVGSEIDDVDMIKLIEESGALVVADRFCYGSLPGRAEIELNDEEDVLRQICRHFMTKSMCPRQMDLGKITARKTYVDQIVKDYHAEGIIIEQMKFCDPWGYERMTQAFAMREDYHYPVLTIDRPYAVGNSGQLRTRVQAFVENLEIKKIQKNQKQEG